MYLNYFVELLSYFLTAMNALKVYFSFMCIPSLSGKGLGALLGGYAFETYGAVTLFRSCSVASVILVVIYAMLHLCFSLRGDKSTPSSSKGEDDDDFEEKGN